MLSFEAAFVDVDKTGDQSNRKRRAQYCFISLNALYSLFGRFRKDGRSIPAGRCFRLLKLGFRLVSSFPTRSIESMAFVKSWDELVLRRQE
jgi:hypothetical protein